MIPVWVAMAITTVCTLVGVAIGVWAAWDRAGTEWPDPEEWTEDDAPPGAYGWQGRER